MPKMYKVIDNAQNYYIDKKNLVNLCVRMIVCGASERSGKSNLILNLLLRPEFYLNDFKGENIFIISPSLKNDNKLKKLIEVKDIPAENLMDEFDETAVTELYKILQEEYEEAIDQGEKPEHKLIIMDDIAYSGDLKAMSFGIISKMACNGRHSLINFIITAQKYTQIPTVLRENANCSIFFSCSNKQLALIEEDHNFLSNKKQFYDMFREATGEKHSFFVVNYTNPKDEMYQNSEFEIITPKNK